MEPITFLASIADTSSSIKFGRDEGRLLLDVPGTDIAGLVKLLLIRDKLLRITIEVEDGN